MRFFAGRVGLLVFALACAQAASAQQPGRRAEERAAELPNFHRVNDGLYRGAQPPPGGMRRLAALGIRTVVNLRDDDGRALAEGEEAAAAGLRYFNVPLGDFGRPEEARVERVLALIEDPRNRPVFVHCKKGADRTGTVVAVYRITHDGWTADEAIHEAKSHGLSWVQFRMKDYISDTYRRLRQRRERASPSRASHPAEHKPRAPH